MSTPTVLNPGTGGDKVSTAVAIEMNSEDISAAPEKVQRVVIAKNLGSGAFSDEGDLPVSITNAVEVYSNAPGLSVLARPAPALNSIEGFELETASGLSSTLWEQIGSTGAGMTLKQLSGNLRLESGTTLDSETLIKSSFTVDGDLVFSFSTQLNQQGDSQWLYIGLVDEIASGAPYTINGVNSITIAATGGMAFTAEDVGKRFNIAQCSVSTGSAPRPSQTALITAVDGSGNVDVDVDNPFAAAGTGTLLLFGLNGIQIQLSTNQLQATIRRNGRGLEADSFSFSPNNIGTSRQMSIVVSNDTVTLFQKESTGLWTQVWKADTEVWDRSTQLVGMVRFQNIGAGPNTNVDIGHLSIRKSIQGLPVSINGMELHSNANDLPVRLASWTDPLSFINDFATTEGLTVPYVKIVHGGQNEAFNTSSSNPLPVHVSSQESGGLEVKPIAQAVRRYGFHRAVSGGVDGDVMGGPGSPSATIGTGMAVNQTGGNLVITSGTTANSETIIRSASAFNPPNLVMRYSTTLSQRIAQNNFIIELVDIIKDGANYTINSATSVTVDFGLTPGGDYNSAFTLSAGAVGQSMMIGGLSSVGVPMRATIASVNTGAGTVTFTVAGWPGSGSGTCCLFGWNYAKLQYSSTTATNVLYDCQRNGYASGDTTATILTTATGHIGTLGLGDSESVFSDQASASATAIELTQRASRARNIPEGSLYLQLRVLNGTSNPASTTTWTVGFVDISTGNPMQVMLSAVSPMSKNSGLPVEIVGNISQAVTGTVTATVTGATQLPVTPTTLFTNSLATVNLLNIKNAAGTLWSVVAANVSASTRYVKLYNKASAPVVASDTPVFTIQVAAGATVTINGGANGIRFATGIGHAITANAADTDNTAVALGDVKLAVTYT